MSRSTLLSIAKYGIAIAILVYLVATDSLQVGLLRDAMARRGDLVVIAALIFLAVLHLGIFRWMLLSRAQNIRLSFWDACRLTFIGHFWNLAVPGSVGGDVVKAYYVASSHPDQKHEAFTAVALDRIIGLYGLFLLASVTIVLFFGKITAIPLMAVLATFILIAVGVSTVGATVFLSQWIRTKLKPDQLLLRLPLGKHFVRIGDAIFVYRSHLPIVLATVLMSVLCHFSLVVMLILCTKAVLPDAEVETATIFVVGPIGFFINAVPLTPGGLGVGETAFKQLLSTATEERVSAGGNIFLLWRTCAYLWMFPGLYFYLRGRGRIKKALAEGNEAATSTQLAGS